MSGELFDPKPFHEPASFDEAIPDAPAVRAQRVRRRLPRAQDPGGAGGGGALMPIRPENRDRYPADWPEAALRVKKRAGWRCECEGECGRGTHDGRCPNVHGQPAYGTGSRVVLTVAHLDHTPENSDDANLRAMCQGCHRHYDREHHADTRRRTLATARESGGQLTLTDGYPGGFPSDRMVDGYLRAAG